MDILVSRTDSNAVTVHREFTKDDREQWLLITGDRHHDNPDCLQDKEKADLELAKKRNAMIIDIGDLFCAMQGKYDKRSSKSKLRPEHQVDNYLDALVDTASEFYAPYSDNFIVFGEGNHETGISKNHETNLTHRLVEKLNDVTGSQIEHLGYTGWVIFRFKKSSVAQNKVLWYTHGYGGGGPVTQDFIQKARQLPYIDADILASAHVHRKWFATDMRLRTNQHGRVVANEIKYVKTSTYKDEYKDGIGGFAVEKGLGPRPIGGVWIRFYWSKKDRLAMDIVDQGE